MCPWENDLFALTLSGQVIYDILEDSVASMSATAAKPSSSRFLQLSGFKVIYNITNPVGNRIVDIKLRCTACEYPKYEPLNLYNDYRLVVMEYLANGMNGFQIISSNAKDLE